MQKIALAALATGFGLLGVTGAQAQGWAHDHPRRVEVNSRLDRQNARITQGIRDGQLSHGQAQALRADDRAMRTEERADASVNRSHITRVEQGQLNQQGSADSAAIYGAWH